MSITTSTPPQCSMPGCTNPVHNPSDNYVAIPTFDDLEIQIPVCPPCRWLMINQKRQGFGFYSMN